MDYEATLAVRAQTLVSNPNGTYTLYRIGEGISACDTHATIYGALKLVRTL